MIQIVSRFVYSSKSFAFLCLRMPASSLQGTKSQIASTFSKISVDCCRLRVTLALFSLPPSSNTHSSPFRISFAKMKSHPFPTRSWSTFSYLSNSSVMTGGGCASYKSGNSSYCSLDQSFFLQISRKHESETITQKRQHVVVSFN